MTILTRSLFPLLAACLALSAPQPARADAGGRQLAERCMVCHGSQGENSLLGIPRIGGREFYDLLADMSSFRGGERLHPVMSVIMRTLDEADMVDVAGYFSAQRPPATY